jgi:signal transduction histidine kinase
MATIRKNEFKVGFRGRIGVLARAFRVRALALVAPVSKNEDTRRQELILNVILIASIIFLTFLDTDILFNSIRLFPNYHGIPFPIFTLVIIGYVWLFIASKRGHSKMVSYIIIGLYTLGALYSGWHWGASLPITLLSFAFISIVASILVGSRFGFFVAALLVIALSALSVHEIYSLGVLPWKYETITATDVITYAAVLLFIAVLSWLSNREIRKSLERARSSEQTLMRERDLLEVTVMERTAQIARMAEFGSLAQGLFHDLMTPLSSVALHMEQIDVFDKNEIEESRTYVKKAIAASQKMGDFMNDIRLNIRENGHSHLEETNSANELISIERKISAVVGFMSYKARTSDVTMITEIKESLFYRGNAFHVRRVLLNLISNAIESFDGIARDDKKVTVAATKENSTIIISVSDNGSGIAPENVQRIFDPFFTTKASHRGIGIGLSTTKNIVEKHLKGTILVESSPGKGTRFVISFPL